jgi:protein-tyrosine phosphatase
MDRRHFLAAAAANTALALAPRAFAAEALEGKATRVPGKGVQLEWNAKSARTAIYVSSDPAAPRRAMRQVKAGVTGGQIEVPADVAPRPYYLLAADGRETRVAERLLPLEGGRNFRDLGGYRADGGRQVRWGRIYRSGVMNSLTNADLDYLSKLDVKVICDLRNPKERQEEPSAFLKAKYPEVVAFDYDMNASMALLASARTREQAVDVFAAAYVQFLDILTPHYTDLFARLAAGEAPLAFNCSAGKDRTGMASALILSVLGVARETIVADYALTQVYTPPSLYKAQMAQGRVSGGGLTPEQAQAFARMPPEVLDIIMGSDPEVMRKALAKIDGELGGPVALAKARFGLTDAKIASMRSAYLV